jgi:hypothetical protein
MKARVKTIFRQIVGVLLLALGVVGLMLPVLQGWLTIAAGLYVLFPADTPTGQKIRAWMKRRKSDVAAQMEKRKNRRRARRERPF